MKYYKVRNVLVLQMEITKLRIFGLDYQKKSIMNAQFQKYSKYYFKQTKGSTNGHPFFLSTKNRLAVLSWVKFQSSKLNGAWQAQFLNHALAILVNNVSFIDVQMV